MDVLCIGEILVDFLPGNEPGSYIRNAGGAPANVAIAVARNGLKSGFIGKVGRDDFGRFLVSTLTANGVENVCTEPTADAVTTMAFVTLHEGGERTFTFVRKPGADMFLSRDDIKDDVIDRTRIVHGGSCSLSQSPAAEATRQALRIAHEKGKIVSFDVNYRPLMWNGDQEISARTISSVFKYVDLLKISEEEVDLVGGETNIPRLMDDARICLVVVTRGASGATYHFGKSVVSVAGHQVEAIDATGAGDAFWGGFLSSLLLDGVTRADHLTEEMVLRATKYGNIAGCLSVQTKGAITSLPTREQILKYRE
ncbi:carbohydrate kinase [Telmatospirillum sp.]|uniref:carbohydrate kinase family protein n=1 Tax=Telmatospirillum sp. TaxID=2079197 RepID=UPI00285088EC|nr:carbohydrate kinase [Telmatospirillum sp.]MDR3438131.1 carbohydrate kinase [Telmatospirillum sp.]